MDQPRYNRDGQGRTDLIVSLQDDSSHGRRGHGGWKTVLPTNGRMPGLLAVLYVDGSRNQVSSAGKPLNASQQDLFCLKLGGQSDIHRSSK